MTETRLTELLHDTVSDVPAPLPGAVDTAWRQGVRRRQRSRTLMSAAAVAVVAVGAVAVVRPGSVTDLLSPDRGNLAASESPSISSTQPGSSAAPDAHYQRVPVWWAPDAADEASLPWVGPNPEEQFLDLSADRPMIEAGTRLLGGFEVFDDQGRWKRFVGVDEAGRSWTIPTGRIAANHDEGGNVAAVLAPNGGLSPDGWTILFAQVDDLVLLDLHTLEQRIIATPRYLAEGAEWLNPDTIWLPDELAADSGRTVDLDGNETGRRPRMTFTGLPIANGDQMYGSWAGRPGEVAQAAFLAGPVEGGAYANPEGIVVSGANRSVLALSVEGRGKTCCNVAGWLDDSWLGFTSKNRLLAWRVGSGEVAKVAEFTGLDGAWFTSSWARDSLSD